MRVGILLCLAAIGVVWVSVAEDGEAPQTAWSRVGAGRVPVALRAAKGIEAWVDCPRADGWRLEVARDDGEAEGVELVRVRLTSDKPAKRPRFEIGFRKADGGRVRTMWRATMGKRTFDTGDALPLRAHASFASSFAFSMPLYAFLDPQDGNVLTLAASESKERVQFRGGTEEGPNSILATFAFNTTDVETPSCLCEVAVRCDTRPLAADRVIPAASAWMRRVDPSPDYPVPEASFDPFYSSWCAYHQSETDAIVEREADEALKLGLRTVLIDWGWQNPPGKNLYYGPHVPDPRYTKDFAAHVRRLHEKGLRVVMWFPISLVTDDNAAFEKYRGRTLYRRSWGPYVWDPRFGDLREYLLGRLETAVRDWKVDGLKLDYGDSWGIDYVDKWKLAPLGKDLAGRDRADVSDATQAFVNEMRRRLTAINPDVTIEFRQMYMGIGMLKGCTQMRVQDCPGSQRDIRNGIASLRLTSGPTAVMTDPVQWGRDESDVQVAESILSSIFSVGQYSVRLVDTKPSHKRLLAHWVRFQNDHRAALQHGDFRVQGLTYDAPVLIGETAEERIVGVYVPGFVAACGAPDRRVIVLNGTGGDAVTVRFDAACTGTRYNPFGEKLDEFTLPAGLSELSLPRGGYAVISSAESVRGAEVASGRSAIEHEREAYGRAFDRVVARVRLWPELAPHETALLPEFKFDAKTPPMLLLHGDDDYYSSLGSVHIYEELHRRKMPAQLMVYSGASHGLNDNVNVRGWERCIIDWIESRGY